MRKIIFINIFLLFATVGLKAQLLPYNGVNYFINGINIPWHNFNNDFGTNYLYGDKYNPQFFDSVFTQCQDYGVNCVRVWLHDDGGTSPDFDSLGFVTGIDPSFFLNLDDFFQRAKDHNIMVIPSIWDFNMMNDDSAWGKFGGMHANLIEDTFRTRSYINNALIPMLTRYANQCNLLAWEIINEPEWSTDVSGNNSSITQHITMAEMQRFVGMLAEAIHKNSSKMCTVGSASLKYNSGESSFPTICVGNFWKDAAIKSAYDKSLAYLDFYEVHYYDWMNTIYQKFDPYDYNEGYWGLDKPTLVGETKGASTIHTPADQLYDAYTGNYSGVLFWSFVGGDGNGNFDTVKSALSAFRNAASAIVDFQGCQPTSISDLKDQNNLAKIYPNPASDKITVVASITGLPVISIYNIQGQILLQQQIKQVKTEVDISRLAKGFYFVKLSSIEKTEMSRLVKE